MRKARWSSALTIVGVWIGLAAIFASITGSINMPHLIKLRAHYGETTAVITRKNCDQHQYAEYSFQVDGQTYQSGDTIEGCDALFIGQIIPLYFDTQNPTNNSTWNVDARFWNEVITIASVCLTFPPLIIFAFRYRMRQLGSWAK